MGSDLIHKRCLEDNERYADLINGLLFGGRQEVHPEDLQELDSPASGSKNRDIVKKVGHGTKFAVIGMENQEKVHYAMPFRSMMYDAQEYDRQVREMRKKVRSIRKEQEKLTEAEYLSGFRKTDKLMPCITMVLYYGDDWDGPMDLMDILDLSDLPPELKKYVNNYPMHLFLVRNFTEKDTEVFRTDLKLIFDFIRLSENGDELRSLVENNPKYQEMDEDAYDMMIQYTNSKELIVRKEEYRKGEKLDVCKAIRDLMEDAELAGVERGRTEGLEVGRSEGRAEGESRMQSLISKMVEAGETDKLAQLTDKEFYQEMLRKYGL